jgi:Lrp/AsnC family transcriptional regulator for asnA, asnC and gidA
MSRKLRVLKNSVGETTLDELDDSLIGKLTQDARTSFRKIAKGLHISPDTVVNRYRGLQGQGVIRGSTIVINPKKIGYQAMAVFMVDTSPTRIPTNEPTPNISSAVLEKLIHMPSILVATKTVGDHDVLAIGVAKNIEHLINLRNEITRIPGVRDLEVSFWAEMTALCPKYFMV